jgi:hypothetical protein
VAEMLRYYASPSIQAFLHMENLQSFVDKTSRKRDIEIKSGRMAKKRKNRSNPVFPAAFLT